MVGDTCHDGLQENSEHINFVHTDANYSTAISTVCQNHCLFLLSIALLIFVEVTPPYNIVKPVRYSPLQWDSISIQLVDKGTSHNSVQLLVFVECLTYVQVWHKVFFIVGTRPEIAKMPWAMLAFP